jgi:hypothetical protein
MGVRVGSISPYHFTYAPNVPAGPYNVSQAILYLTRDASHTCNCKTHEQHVTLLLK